MMPNGALPATLVVLLSLTPVVCADILRDTLANDQVGAPSAAAYYIHNFPPAQGFAGDDARAAVPFIIPPGLSYGLDSIILNVAARFTNNPRLTVSVQRSDSAGLPGTTIDSWTINNLPVQPDGGGPATHPLTTVPTPAHPILDPGKYWVSLSGPDPSLFSDVYWYHRDDLRGQVASMSAPLNGTGWLISPSVPTPQVRVTATAVPEPTATLLLVGVLALARRRR